MIVIPRTLTYIGIGFLLAGVLSTAWACAQKPKNTWPNPANKVWVVAHRADWRYAPENSLAGIQHCIDLGVDMVEIDVQATADGSLILMHDRTIDRTTTGTGRVSQWSLDSLRSIHLKNGYGLATHHTVPTLEEAFRTCQGKIAVMVDKGYRYIPQIYAMAQKLGMAQQIYFEGDVTVAALAQRYPSLMHKIQYMPRVGEDTKNRTHYLEEFNTHVQPPVYIVSFQHDDAAVLKQIPAWHTQHVRAMAASLWDQACAGHTDDVSLHNPAQGWQWLIQHGFTAICTDRPAALLQYLRETHHHL